jgi:tetratricopeptide (TPR) repeat protein
MYKPNDIIISALCGLLFSSIIYESILLIVIFVVLLTIYLIWLHRWFLTHPIAQWKIRRRDLQGAVDQLSKTIQQRPMDAKAHYMRAYLHLQLGRDDEALEDFSVAVELKPEWTQCHFQRGEIFLRREEYENAKECADECLKAAPWWIDALSLRGTAHCYLNNYVAARTDFEEILRLKPTSGRGQVGMSYLCMDDNPDEAIRLCTEVLDLPTNRVSVAYNNRAVAYAIKGMMDESLADCNAGLEFRPTMPYLYGTRGHTYFLLGQYQEALADFKREEELMLNHAYAIAGQAVTLHALGEIHEAQEMWKRLATLKPENADPQQLQMKYKFSKRMLEEAENIVSGMNESDNPDRNEK